MCVVQRAGLNPPSWFLLVCLHRSIVCVCIYIYHFMTSCVFFAADTAQMGLVETRLAIIPGGGNFHFRFFRFKIETQFK